MSLKSRIEKFESRIKVNDEPPLIKWMVRAGWEPTDEDYDKAWKVYIKRVPDWRTRDFHMVPVGEELQELIAGVFKRLNGDS